ncbi:MAG: carbohydrate ABC transporter substrate-binding protein [Propionibacteriales bacterium]|nr:carbohydrate ABC transporter substrate-binding protein [Propionibacteriales bacterium]
MKRRSAGIALAAICLVAAGCSSTDSETPDKPEAPASAVEAARSAALKSAGGQQLGGKVTMLGVLGGEELDAFKTVLAPFEEATGVEVQYEGTRDFAAVLQTRVAGGNPPDLVTTPAIGEMAGLAAEGSLVDLQEVVGEETLQANFSQSLLDTASLDGEVFGIFNSVNLGGLIWYNPKTYDGPTDPKSWSELQQWAAKTADSGTTPWCVGLESGAASGWPAADFIDEILLRQAGPEFHKRWQDGEEPWTSPEVKAAFETYGGTVTDGMVYGDTTTALSTNFAKAANPMFSDPPACYLLQQATFMGGIITDSLPNLKPGVDLDFFPAPDFNEEYPAIRSISGEIVGMINQTSQSDALVKYLATREAGTLIASTGRWLSPNSNVETGIYRDPFLKKASEVLAEAQGTYSLGNSLMPQTVVDAFWQAGLAYTQDPGDLDSILAKIEQVR